MTKKLVIENVSDDYGRPVHQIFSVWDTKRKVMVYWARDREDAENYIRQGELDL
ncbi:MAG: hypothetical protein ACYSWS_05950 [Planctomycetota bacterium]|jgi:hypothetical protein